MVTFLYSGGLWFLFTVEVPPCGWGWAIGLSKFPGKGSLPWCSGGWNWVSSLWSAMKCPVVSFEVSVGLVWLLATCILMLGVMFLCCWRISLVCMSCSEICWLLGGAWFQCRYGGFWMSSCLLMFPGTRSSLVFSCFGVKPPASGFQSYSYSRLKTSPSIQHK